MTVGGEARQNPSGGGKVKERPEVDELSAEVRALRKKLDAKSLVEFDRMRHPISGPGFPELGWYRRHVSSSERCGGSAT